jgi:cupin 2 domain-containing protein
MSVTVENLFEGIAADLPDEVFDTIIQRENIRIERIVSQGHTSPDPDKSETGWYDQDRHEWVLLIEGSATIEFEEDGCVELNRGDYLNIPAHRKHRVVRTCETHHTIWLAVHY